MRRSWLVFALVFGFAAIAGPAQAHTPAYTHGVASGDVTTNSAILWTRVDQATRLQAQVSTSSTFGVIAFSGRVDAVAANDFTAKIDATGLKQNTRYFYRFGHHGAFSRVGNFRTAPGPNASANVRFTYTGDSDGTRSPDRPAKFGNFEVLDAARQEQGNFWVYLGDTIYSDSRLRPTGPATTLPEYRAAYKENRTYAALRNIFKSTSTYPQWDDHEVHNDFDGQTVDPARYAAGRKAFFEYMPIRETNLPKDPTCAGDPLYREFKWGSEVDIIIPDERSCRSADVEAACPNNGPPAFGPTDPAPTAPASIREAFGFPAEPAPGCLEAINDPSRTMLGPVQKQALKAALLDSTATYKLIINEVPIQQFYALPYDRWEGYNAERKELIDFIRVRGIKNVVFLTTDTHATILNQVFKDRDKAPFAAAYEIVTGPIATDTFRDEIVDFGGGVALAGANILMNHAGVDCRDLDTNSYGLVSVVAATDTATVTSKDENGAPIHNGADPGQPICSKAFGP